MASSIHIPRLNRGSLHGGPPRLPTQIRNGYWGGLGSACRSHGRTMPCFSCLNALITNNSGVFGRRLGVCQSCWIFYELWVKNWMGTRAQTLNGYYWQFSDRFIDASLAAEKKEIKYRKRKPKWKWKRTRQIMGKWWLKFSAIIRLNYGVNVGQDLWFLSCPLNAPNSCKRDPRICIRNGERTDCCSVTLKSILQFICINYLPTICMRCWPAWQIKNLKAWH